MSARWEMAKQQAAHDARMAERGCSLEQYRFLRNMGKTSSPKPLRAYQAQKNNAARRGVEWHLTVWEWWTVWQESGHEISLVKALPATPDREALIAEAEDALRAASSR